MFAWLSLVALFAGPAGGNGEAVYFEQTTVLASGGRARGAGVRSRVWYAGLKMRLEPAGTRPGPALILRLDRGKAYQLDPAERQVQELDLAELRRQSRADAALAGELMGARAAGGVRTVALQASRRIAGYACQGYRLSAGSAQVDVYVSDQLGVGVEAFADFLEWSGASEAMEGLMTELRKLPGFPLETRSRVSVLDEVQETISTVTRVEVGPQPAALFEPPRGWTLLRPAQPE